jgi:hypothetical protein
VSLNELAKNVAGINQAEVITDYKTAQDAYDTSLQVGANIIQNTLIDFLS